VFLKYGRSGAPHYRTVWVLEDLSAIAWGETRPGKERKIGWATRVCTCMHAGEQSSGNV
jgi:hypothetical protein